VGWWCLYPSFSPLSLCCIAPGDRLTAAGGARTAEKLLPAAQSGVGRWGGTGRCASAQGAEGRSQPQRGLTAVQHGYAKGLPFLLPAFSTQHHQKEGVTGFQHHSMGLPPSPGHSEIRGPGAGIL
jgi:hypothetical protein